MLWVAPLLYFTCGGTLQALQAWGNGVTVDGCNLFGTLNTTCDDMSCRNCIPSIVETSVSSVSSGSSYMLITYLNGTVRFRGHSRCISSTFTLGHIVKTVTLLNASLLLSSSGEVFAFGENLGHLDLPLVDVQVPTLPNFASGQRIVDVAMAYNASFFVLLNGSVLVTGGGPVRGTTLLVTPSIINLSCRVISVEASAVTVSLTCENRSVFAFGLNDRCQVGPCNLMFVVAPLWLADNVLSVALSPLFTLIARIDGTVEGKGDNSANQLTQNLPLVVSELSRIVLQCNATQVAVGLSNSVILCNETLFTSNSPSSNVYVIGSSDLCESQDMNNVNIPTPLRVSARIQATRIFSTVERRSFAIVADPSPTATLSPSRGTTQTVSQTRASPTRSVSKSPSTLPTTTASRNSVTPTTATSSQSTTASHSFSRSSVTLSLGGRSQSQTYTLTPIEPPRLLSAVRMGQIILLIFFPATNYNALTLTWSCDEIKRQFILSPAEQSFGEDCTGTWITSTLLRILVSSDVSLNRLLGISFSPTTTIKNTDETSLTSYEGNFFVPFLTGVAPVPEDLHSTRVVWIIVAVGTSMFLSVMVVLFVVALLKSRSRTVQLPKNMPPPTVDVEHHHKHDPTNGTHTLRQLKLLSVQVPESDPEVRNDLATLRELFGHHQINHTPLAPVEQ